MKINVLTRGSLQGPVINVQITRMASKEIADRQRMFELLELLQVDSFS